jgi:hypothetical protein
VYLLERINNTAREVMTHLKAIVFVRPTKVCADGFPLACFLISDPQRISCYFLIQFCCGSGHTSKHALNLRATMCMGTVIVSLQSSIDALVAELKRPKYGSYDICE